MSEIIFCGFKQTSEGNVDIVQLWGGKKKFQEEQCFERFGTEEL